MLTCLLAGASAWAAATSEATRAWQEQLEKDWLLEAQMHVETQTTTHLTTRDDAAGGCDGVTNGKWGFHTGQEANPWWQVDLGQSQPLARVQVWNRADSEDQAARAARFILLLSDDGKEWRQVYQHNGKIFYGYRMPDRSPLVVRLTNAVARYVRIQLPGTTFLHLDEVEVIGVKGGNLALHKPADQSSISQWSAFKFGRPGNADAELPLAWIMERGVKLLANLQHAGVNTAGFERELASDAASAKAFTKATPTGERNTLYFKLRTTLRAMALANPLLDFDAVLFTKRVPGSYSHMSDQNYGWWSRPGGGIYILRGIKGDAPTTECLTDSTFKEPGSFLRPALSFDGTKLLFAWCKHYPQLAAEKDKLNKANVPEDAFYHVFEMNIDGSGVRQLTHGKYDDFDGRYLPDGRLVFLSTRRGQAIQVDKASAAATLARNDLPDSYVRCGGDASRPVAVYTLHTMNAGGGDLTPISPFEMFEWEPSIAHDGTILYSRWDYIDRDNMPYMSLWSINPDGINARLIYKNYSRAPHCTFEPRAIPGSDKIIFTASGHHSQTMGSLVLLDPKLGSEGADPITRLTPEVPFPEIEGWPRAYYANPWPLSERTHLVAWGVEDNISEGRQRPRNGMGLYLFDADSGRELLYRDADISAMFPIPLKAQPRPPVLASQVNWEGPQEGRFLLADVTRGLKTVHQGDVKALRIVAVPAKTQPWMNQPVLGLTHDDPGKAVLGTVPVEADGSAYFRVPSGVTMFFQALDARGMVVQTMRSATHVQPGQTLSCTGCHDPRKDTPPTLTPPLASLREPSKITVGPEGSWTMRFDQLVQPLLNAQCVSCHNPKSEDVQGAKFDLTPEHAYKSLTFSGRPSLNDLVLSAYRDGVSTEGHNPALQSPMLRLLTDPAGHHGVQLDGPSVERLVTWMDTYAQRVGTFSREQEEDLQRLRRVWANLLIERVPQPAAARTGE